MGGYGHGPNAHTMSSVYEHDDVFLDLANNPKVIPLLEEIIGPDVQTMEMVCHCHHAGTQAHTAWHRDWPAWSHPQFTLKAKVFYFLDDQTEDMGCFTVVPGTHKLPDNPSRDQYSGPDLEKMPGLKKIIGKAGDAILWNVLLWHTGTANISDRDRRIVIYGYMPFWVKKWEDRRPPQNVIDWADTPFKRQLMGIHNLRGRKVWDRRDVPVLEAVGVQD
jgi:ectoine hydroxylase-related dioxygenase (phytanoyl-CoA dioxygenase family)